MQRKASVVCAGVLFSMFAAISIASAVDPRDGGLVGLHALVRNGTKVCMADHYHDGYSSGEPSRKAAEVAAARSWVGFTAWEYGSAWGSFAMAESKKISCSGSGNSWSCSVSARPCRKR